jgi:hypothetical protein
LGAIKRAIRAGHFANDVVKRLFRDLSVKGLAGDLEGIDVSGDEQGIVVEHFFEVWDEPARVGAVAVEAAAKLVVHAAAGHMVERFAGHGEGVFVAEASM